MLNSLSLAHWEIHILVGVIYKGTGEPVKSGPIYQWYNIYMNPPYPDSLWRLGQVLLFIISDVSLVLCLYKSTNLAI